MTNATWQGEYTGTGLIIFELSGVAASSALDVTSASSPGATGTTASSGNTAGTSTAGEIALGAVIDAETFTGTDASYTNVTMGSPISCIAGYMLVPNAGTSVVYTAPANEDNVVGGIVFTLKPAGATAPLTVTTTTLPGATVGTAYSATLAASGGSGTGYTWSYTGSLPAGLALSDGGVISGTPTAAGAADFTAEVTDSADDTATAALSITVTGGGGGGTEQVGPGNTTLGWASSANGQFALAMLEILPVLPSPPAHAEKTQAAGSQAGIFLLTEACGRTFLGYERRIPDDRAPGEDGDRDIHQDPAAGSDPFDDFHPGHRVGHLF